MIIVPQNNPLQVRTEFGFLFCCVGEVVVVPKGLKITVSLPAGPCRGWMGGACRGADACGWLWRRGCLSKMECYTV